MNFIRCFNKKWWYFLAKMDLIRFLTTGKTYSQRLWKCNRPHYDSITNDPTTNDTEPSAEYLWNLMDCLVFVWLTLTLTFIVMHIMTWLHMTLDTWDSYKIISRWYLKTFTLTIQRVTELQPKIYCIQPD